MSTETSWTNININKTIKRTIASKRTTLTAIVITTIPRHKKKSDRNASKNYKEQTTNENRLQQKYIQ